MITTQPTPKQYKMYPLYLALEIISHKNIEDLILRFETELKEYIMKMEKQAEKKNEIRVKQYRERCDIINNYLNILKIITPEEIGFLKQKIKSEATITVDKKYIKNNE